MDTDPNSFNDRLELLLYIYEDNLIIPLQYSIHSGISSDLDDAVQDLQCIKFKSCTASL